MKNFKDLFVWQKSITLAVLIYKITRKFPDEEKYGLASQMRRAAISISSNIAEGHMRSTDKDFGNFLAIARGSCAELETQNIISLKLGYVAQADHDKSAILILEITKILTALYVKVTHRKVGSGLRASELQS